MKQFEYLIYGEGDKVPFVHHIEESLNTFRSEQGKLHEMLKVVPEDRLHQIALACILYWAETERFDERNRYAVFASRVIVERFPELLKKKFTDQVQLEAATLTGFVHRTLQQYFFWIIVHLILRDGDTAKIVGWFETASLHYNADMTALI